MLRNRADVLARAHSIDDTIHDIGLFSPAGVIVEHSGADRAQSVPREILTVMRRSDDTNWSLETQDHLVAGRTIYSQSGNMAGAIYARYPLTELDRLRGQFQIVMLWASLMAFLICGFTGWISFGIAARRNRNQTVPALQVEVQRSEEALAAAEQDCGIVGSVASGRSWARALARTLPVQLQAIPETPISREISKLTMAVFAGLVLVALLGLAVTVQKSAANSL